LSSAIVWILILSGAITALGGLGMLAFPRPIARVVFGLEKVEGTWMFFARHWGVLIFAIGALLIYGGYFPAARTAILSAGAFEKIAGGILVIATPTRTKAMIAVALFDGFLALVYIVYLAVAGSG